MALTPDEQAELDALNSEASAPSTSKLSVPEQAELDSLNALAGLEPPSLTKEDTALSRMHAGEPANTPFRVLRDPRFRATVASIAAPELLIGAVPELAPAAASGVAGWLGRLALSGGVSGGAYETALRAPQVASGEVSPSDALKSIAGQSLFGAGIGTVGGVVGQKALQTGLGAVGRAFGGPIAKVGANLKQGAAEGFVRPLFESEANAEHRIASAFLESVTGQKPAQSIGEALGKKLGGGTYAELEAQLGSDAKGAITPDTRNKLSRSIIHTAAKLMGTGATAEQIGERTVDAIQREIGQNISGPAKAAIGDLATELEGSLKASLGRTAAEGAGLVRPSIETTPFEAGMAKKKLLEESQNLFQTKVAQAFNDYRQSLGEEAMAPGLPDAKAAVEEIQKSGLFTTKTTPGEVSSMVNEFGRPIVGESTTVQAPIPKTVNAEVRGRLDEILQAAATEQPIENLRKYISGVNSDITYGPLSTLDDHLKKKLKNALKSDLMNALDALPNSAPKQKLIEANKLFSGEGQDFGVDEILNSTVTRGAKDFDAGGVASETLYKQALGSTSGYNNLKRLAGDRFEEFKDILRNAALSDATRKATSVSGDFSVGDAFKALQLPKEVQSDLFPQMDRLRELASKELKASGLLNTLPSDPEKVLDWMHVNQGEMADFLAPGGEQKFVDAVRAKAAEQQRFNNSVIRDVAAGHGQEVQKNPVKFLDSILSGTLYTKPGEVKEALDVVGRHSPKTLQDIQVRFVEKLLNDSDVSGYVSGEELAKKLAAPMAGKRPTPSGAGIPPSSGGSKFSVAQEVLGKAKTDSIRSVADELGKTQKNLLGRELPYQEGVNRKISMLEAIGKSFNPTDLATLVASGPLNNRSRGLLYSLFIETPQKLRYNIAASLINDPKLLPLLTKPVESLNGAEASILATSLGEGVTNRR